jgi:hypothetical protein
MKKIVLSDTAFYREYSLIGISTHLKDYRLTWHLNDKLSIELRKKQDFCLEKAGMYQRFFSLYTFEDELHRVFHTLLSNKSGASRLFDKWAHLDYVLLLNGDGARIALDKYLKPVRDIQFVLHTEILNPDTEKNFQAIASDLELVS